MILIVQVVIQLLVAATALAVVLTQRPERLVVTFGVYGLVLVVLFLVEQAPDVALSEAVVGLVIMPPVLLTAIAKTRGSRLR